MKLIIEITLKKEGGKTCEPEEVFELISEEWDGLIFYPQSSDSDEESEYTVTNVTRRPA